jgi:ComF family protein
MLQNPLARLPSICAVCHSWPARPVCEACVARFARPVPRCATCALPVPEGIRTCGACVTQPPPVDACIAAVDYTYPWPDLVADFKFHAQPSWAKPMAQLMRSMPHAEQALETADWLLPMPLAAQRLKLRGYNQAWELTRLLTTQHRKATPNLLLRVIDTPAQAGLQRENRLLNLREAMAVDPLRAHLLQGKRVVLVDDVMTSGASVHACAAVLRQAGVAHITALVFARTPLAH